MNSNQPDGLPLYIGGLQPGMVVGDFVVDTATWVEERTSSPYSILGLSHRWLGFAVEFTPPLHLPVEVLVDHLHKEYHGYGTPEKRPKKQAQGAYRAWRLWKLTEDNKLKALTRNHIWAKGENKVDAPHYMANGMSKRGGFYGFFDLDTLRRQELERYVRAFSGNPHPGLAPPYLFSTDYVVGSIVTYGWVKIAEHGIRAERAIPEHIILSADDDYNLRLLNVAEAYGMKMVTLKEAEMLPTGLIPWMRE